MEQNPHIPNWTLGERLRKAREDMDVTQKELAALIGISDGTVQNYEGDKIERPKGIVIREWARVTGVPLWWLWGSDAPTPAHSSGWTYGADVVDLADRGRRSDWIYVSPDQLTFDAMLNEAA